MKIRMLQTVPGSIDGVRVTDYEAGAEYDLSATPGAQELAAAFVGAGMAEAADAETELAPYDGGELQPGDLIEPESPEAAATLTKIEKPAKAKK